MSVFPHTRKLRIGSILLLFLIAALPRFWQLGRFVTPDEILFLDHARQLLMGFHSGQPSLALGIGYPGVTVAWVAALGLLVLFGLSRLGIGPLPAPGIPLEDFLAGADALPLPYYVAGRAATALLGVLLIFVLMALAMRLFKDEQVLPGNADETTEPGARLRFAIPVGAGLAFLLFALDPFLLSYSRLLHIAIPLALFMLLAVMSWLLWLRKGISAYLLLTALFTGLALLTKSTAILLFPMFFGMILFDRVLICVGDPTSSRSNRRPLLVDLGACLGVSLAAAALFWALWPAMWHNPETALTLTFGKLWVDKDAGEGNLGMYWMGQFVEDPGPGFYPVALLLKISPLIMLGLLASLVSLAATILARLRAKSEPMSGNFYGQLALWIYALIYLLIMVVASKKSVRYLLPAYAAFVPLAALGLLRFKNWILRRLPGLKDRPVWLAIPLAILLLALSLPYAPYYFSYYNPAVLGWRWAPRAILVGWGEGLDQAAEYLNQAPEAASLHVSAWYERSFAPFFVGQTLALSGQNAIQSDNTVFYINQVQRDIPDPNLVDYFQRRQALHVVRLNGIDYAWVYPPVISQGPVPPNTTPVGITMGDAVVLEAYSTRPTTGPEPGLNVTLYWRALRSDLPDYFVYTRAVDAANEIRARADSPPVMGFWPSSRWKQGQLIADEQLLLRPPDTPPGPYHLEIGMYAPQSWEVLEPAAGQRGWGGGLILGEIQLP